MEALQKDGNGPIAALMSRIGRQARAAARALAVATSIEKNRALEAMAQHLADGRDDILAANAADCAAAARLDRPAALIDRLRLDDARLAAMIDTLRAVAALPDPVGAILSETVRPNGLRIARRRVPIGVIAVIYESRPNVTIDAAALSLKSGNAVILRGGSESHAGNGALYRCIVLGLADAGLPSEAVQFVPTTDRAAVGELLRGLDGAIDLLIPRGGRSLVERVRAEARVPVLGHLEGNCHIYVDAAADAATACRVVVDAKLRRPGICGAAETLLIDRRADAALVLAVLAALLDRGCEVRGDATLRSLDARVHAASESDWSTEYLAPIIAARIVDGVDGAIGHIERYGSGHTEAILTEDGACAERFLQRIDSAIVLHNASTQFADGGEFGLGAEIGISTDRLHARGPVGLEELTTYKYVVRGSGQVRG